MTKQLISSLLLVSTSLALAIPSLSLADCSQWQSNPASVNVNDLANTNITAVKDCMSSCANSDYGLSASNSDLTPALCMQNVSYVEYLTQFAHNNANAANTTLSSSSSSSVSSTAPASTTSSTSSSPSQPANLESTNQTQPQPQAEPQTQPEAQTQPETQPESKPEKKSFIKWL